MLRYDKDMERVMQAKKREIVQELEQVKKRILEEVGFMTKTTLTRFSNIESDYNRIEFAINEKVSHMETSLNNSLKAVEDALNEIEKAFDSYEADYEGTLAKLEEMETLVKGFEGNLSTITFDVNTMKNDFNTVKSRTNKMYITNKLDGLMRVTSDTSCTQTTVNGSDKVTLPSVYGNSLILLQGCTDEGAYRLGLFYIYDTEKCVHIGGDLTITGAVYDDNQGGFVLTIPDTHVEYYAQGICVLG